MAGRWRDGIQSGLRSAQPAFGDVAVGTLYFVTDEGVLERSTGAAWVAVAVNADGHADIDHTGLTGVGGGGGSSLLDAWVGTIPPYSVNSTGTNTGVANRGVIVPFVPKENHTITTVSFRVQSQNGNYDFGVYNSSLARLASLGTTAMPATGNQTASLSVSLTAGTLYYFGYAFSGTTGTVYGWNAGVSAVDTNQNYIQRMESALPLPATFVPTGADDLSIVSGFWLS